MFLTAFISDSCDFTLHFHFQCSEGKNLVDILIYLTDAYTLTMARVGHARAHG